MIINNLKSGANSLNEGGQNIAGRFTICKSVEGGYEALEPTMKCRDYFSDWLIATYAEYDAESRIYGFLARGKSNPMPLDKLRLFYDGNVNQLNKNIHLIHELEENLDDKTIINLVYDKDKKVGAVLEASNFWLKDTFTLHFYTLLVRSLSAMEPVSSIDDILKSDTQEGLSGNDFRNFKTGVLSLYQSGFLKHTNFSAIKPEHLVDAKKPGQLTKYHSLGGCINLGGALKDKERGDARYSHSGALEEQYREYKQLLLGG